MFFVSSTLNQMCRVLSMQDPHFFFMRRMLQRDTDTFSVVSHFAIKSGMADRSCSRRQRSSSSRQSIGRGACCDIEQEPPTVNFKVWGAGAFNDLESVPPTPDAATAVGVGADPARSGPRPC